MFPVWINTAYTKIFATAVTFQTVSHAETITIAGNAIGIHWPTHQVPMVIPASSVMLWDVQVAKRTTLVEFVKIISSSILWFPLIMLQK